MPKSKNNMKKAPKPASKLPSKLSSVSRSIPKTSSTTNVEISNKVSSTKASKGISLTAPKLYSSFLPLPISLPLPVSLESSSSSTSASPSTATHYLYCRPHAPTRPNNTTTIFDSDAAAEAVQEPSRTLFVANIPVDVGERDLRTLFSRWGVIESVEIGSGTIGNALEQAVRGIEDDEDSEDESTGEEEEDVEAQNTADVIESTEALAGATFLGTKTSALPRSKRPRRKPNTLPPSVPSLISLPPLDPRTTPLGLSGGRTARITYLDAVSVTRVMAYSAGGIHLTAYSTDTAEPTGLGYYTARYDSLRPSLPIVRAHADSAMARHDHLVSLLLSSRARKQGAGALVDEDGFTVVVRGGRYGRTGGRTGDPGGAGVGVASKGFAKDVASGKKKSGKGAGELVDFYKFQTIDRKRQELAGLRARFENDRKRVDELKKSRKFTPY